MNRNVMIGGIVAIVVVIILVVVFVMGGGDDEGPSGDELTEAFEALLAGDPEPAKELACEADHASIDAAAEAMSALPEDADASVSCEVEGDTATCDLSLMGETDTITSPIVDGQICGGFDFGGGPADAPSDEEAPDDTEDTEEEPEDTEEEDTEEEG